MPELLDRGENPLGLLAGVDDQAAVGAVAAEDEAVLGHLADGEHADVHTRRGYRYRDRGLSGGGPGLRPGRPGGRRARA